VYRAGAGSRLCCRRSPGNNNALGWQAAHDELPRFVDHPNRRSTFVARFAAVSGRKCMTPEGTLLPCGEGARIIVPVLGSAASFGNLLQNRNKPERPLWVASAAASMTAGRFGSGGGSLCQKIGFRQTWNWHNACCVVSIPHIPIQETNRRVKRIQAVTIAWMSVEAVVSLFAAWWARSPALLAFGGDSAIELFSAVVVLWRFRASAAHEDVEKRAARVAGALLFALAAYVAMTSVASLLGYSEPKTTFLGIAILVAAAAVMPWLAREKRRLSGATGSAALRADAAQSALCAYLSLIALAGLAINGIWHLKWADSTSGMSQPQ
jgi:hypothetical protein